MSRYTVSAGTDREKQPLSEESGAKTFAIRGAQQQNKKSGRFLKKAAQKLLLS
jgi:hypothetical protein